MGAEVSCLKRTPSERDVVSEYSPSSMSMPTTPSSSSYSAPVHNGATPHRESMPSRNTRTIIRLTALMKRLSYPARSPNFSANSAASRDVTRGNSPSPSSVSRSFSSQRPPAPLTLATDFSDVDAALTDCVDGTPTGAAALKYRHFCPICYRHFAEIYVTDCCRQNICYTCMALHIETKMGGEHERMTVPCPSCNTDGCQFDRVGGAVAARIYDESPKTKAALTRRQYTPRTLSRQTSDPAFALDPLRLQRIHSIPEYTSTTTGEAMTESHELTAESPSLVPTATATALRYPNLFTFTNAIPVAAS